MKKLDSTMHRFRIVLTLVLALAVVTSLVLVGIQVRLGAIADDVRATLRQINAVTALVRDQGDLAGFAWAEMNAGLYRNGSTALPATLAQTDPAAFRQQASLRAAEANQFFYDRLHRTLAWSSATLVGFSVLLVLALVLMGLFVRRLDHFRGKVEEHLEAITDAIHFLPPRQLTPDSWAEDHALRQSTASVLDELRVTRQLLELGERETRLDSLMNELLTMMQGRIPCERLALAFIDPFGNVVAEDFATTYPERQFQQGFLQKLEESSLVAVMSSRQTRVIGDLAAYLAAHPRSEATRLLVAEGMRSSLTIPLVSQDRVVAFLFLNSRFPDAYRPEHVARSQQLIQSVKHTLFHLYTLQQILAEMSRAFVTLMERKDNETSLHIRRMSYYSYYTARVLASRDSFRGRLTPRVLREILWFAPLHDIGKIGIPDRILLKEGPLEAEERRTMESHVVFGAQVIETINRGLTTIMGDRPFSTAVELIQGHHEKWNGSGYPSGQSGEDIPLAARIVAVGDVFDALTSRRPYKEAWSWDRAADFIRERSGKDFDPDVVSAFFDAQPQLREIYDRYKEV